MELHPCHVELMRDMRRKTWSQCHVRVHFAGETCGSAQLMCNNVLYSTWTVHRYNLTWIFEPFISHLSLYCKRKSIKPSKHATIRIKEYISLRFHISFERVNIKLSCSWSQDIQEFLDKAEHGAIYFSLGSNLQTHQLSIGSLTALYKALGSLKQRVLWKHGEDVAIHPANIKFVKWAPQQAILGKVIQG